MQGACVSCGDGDGLSWGDSLNQNMAAVGIPDLQPERGNISRVEHQQCRRDAPMF